MAEYFTHFLVFSWLFLTIPSFSHGASSPDSIFILGGQSNMAGRGGVSRVAPRKWHWDGKIPPASTSDPSVLRFTANNNWEIAREPLHRDIDPSKTNGIGPGMAFANELRAAAGVKAGVIGLVPCAIGGTRIREWSKGTRKYSWLVDRIKAASESDGGKVEAFLWYQGESDASVKEDAEFYQKNLAKFLTDLRNDLHSPELPVILVKIATHDTNISPTINYRRDVRRAEEAVGQKLPNVKTVDALKIIGRGARGLNADHAHLNTTSVVSVGKMLAHAFLSGFRFQSPTTFHIFLN